MTKYKRQDARRMKKFIKRNAKKQAEGSGLERLTGRAKRDRLYTKTHPKDVKAIFASPSRPHRIPTEDIMNNMIWNEGKLLVDIHNYSLIEDCKGVLHAFVYYSKDVFNRGWKETNVIGDGMLPYWMQKEG